MLLFSFLLGLLVGNVAVDGQALQNIASCGVATQDSTYYSTYKYYGDNTADLAIDGKTSGYWWDRTCACNKAPAGGGWWNLKLDTEQQVYSVVLWNRLDCCQTRLTGAKVYAGDTLCGTISVTGGASYTVTCGSGRGVLTDNIRVVHETQQYLTLCEVQVMSSSSPSTTCSKDNGEVMSQGQTYEADFGKTCTCGLCGRITCACKSSGITCGSGLEEWLDPETCDSTCIRGTGYCRSSGDPHYLTFDGKYYDFHGQCTYKAASCGDFEVYFKNYDLRGGPPRYTGRIEVVFLGQTFAVANGYKATVDGVQVAVPYVKKYTNGDRIEIVNNGQLEILVYNKKRHPAVRARATNAGSYIHAELWLHGSCANETEGLCGSFNGNAADDLIGGSPNVHGERYKQYDENCPAPPKPYHPCDDVDDGHNQAEQICNDLKGSPFASCNAAVSAGNMDGGPINECATDVCNCFLDETCACGIYDSYASKCIEAGIDLADWREHVSYCPLECPAGQVYKSKGPNPAPTCLEKDPEQEGSVRGCFCPKGQYFEDNKCVEASQCRCLYEGVFYNNGDTIKKDSECKTCRCEDAGQMTCEKLLCPALTCPAGQIQATQPDQCCPVCVKEWVVSVNPVEKCSEGQDVTFTTEVLAGGVSTKDIHWYKNGVEITSVISKNRLRLTVSDTKEGDSGEYKCVVKRGDVVAEALFELTVEVEEEPTEPVTPVIITPSKTKFNCAAGKKGCKLGFKVKKEGAKMKAKDIQICRYIDNKTVDCKTTTFMNKFGFSIKFDKTVSENDTGSYVCVVKDEGKTIVSDPVELVVWN